jgi:hypothetical protein
VGGETAGRPLVEFQGRIVVAAAVVFQGQAEQRPGMVPVGLHRPLVQRDHLARVSAQFLDGRECGHGGPALVEIVGRLLDGPGELIQNGQGFPGFPGVAKGFRPRQGHFVAIVPGLLGQIVVADGFLIPLQGESALGQVEMGQSSAVSLGQHLDRPAIPPQEV